MSLADVKSTYEKLGHEDPLYAVLSFRGRRHNRWDADEFFEIGKEIVGYRDVIRLIVTALFGALHPLWTIPSSFLFGGLLVGANSLQRAVQVPQALIVALNGLVVVFVVSSDWLRQRLGLIDEAHQPEGENNNDASPTPDTVEVET